MMMQSKITKQSFLVTASLLLLLAVISPVQASASASASASAAASSSSSTTINEGIKTVVKPNEILLAANDDEIQVVKEDEDDLQADTDNFLRAVAANPNQAQRELLKLGDCQSDCDRDSDCSNNSVCYQRRTHSPIPPCCTGSMPPDSRDYCVPVGCSAPTAPTSPAPTKPPTNHPTPGPTTLAPAPGPTAPTTSAPTVTPTKAPTPAPVAPTTAAPTPAMAPVTGDGDISIDVDINIPDIPTTCFSGDVMVDVLGKGKVAMANLMIGDRLLSSHGRYQPVYSFGHYAPITKGDFLVISTDNKDSSKLEITGEHLIFVQGKSAPVRAETLVVGEKLTPSGATITKISSVIKTGLYAPLTPDATFLVNGHQVSSYAALVQYDTKSEYVQLQNGGSLPISQHNLIHVVLSPFRMWCTNASWLTSGVSGGVCNSYNESGMPNYIHRGITILTWTNKRSTLFQASFFSVVFPVFGVLVVLEQIQQQFMWVLAFVALVVLGKKMMTSSGLRIKVKAL